MAVVRAQRANAVPWIVCNSAASCCRNYATHPGRGVTGYLVRWRSERRNGCPRGSIQPPRVTFPGVDTCPKKTISDAPSIMGVGDPGGGQGLLPSLEPVGYPETV